MYKCICKLMQIKIILYKKKIANNIHTTTKEKTANAFTV